VLPSLNLPARLFHDTPPSGLRTGTLSTHSNVSDNMQETCKIAGFSKVTQKRKGTDLNVAGFKTPFLTRFDHPRKF
jgi:hypothetical protein